MLFASASFSTSDVRRPADLREYSVAFLKVVGSAADTMSGVEVIVSAHQWPSVIAVWCLENYCRVNKVQYRPRTTRVGRHSTVAGYR
ncbi:hypothetical protein EVAR_25009_1 [Eumeta japonica]|uniref:Uncharacterized protein n=1 Tax=Eumeta variegata TaxID=151549 RepID=A0A4C1V6D8_EUMVA|nr:hypothetical protein EVAR_25009_1 [Eumeta japonica]